MTTALAIRSQTDYHRELFAALYQWETFWTAAIDLTGDQESAVEMALDQLGHFGPRGVSLLVDRLMQTATRPLTRIVELGSGFGGALRQVRRALRTRDVHPALIGVELVREHCDLAATIGRTIGASDVLLVQADARRLPLRSASVDAVFAAGSASHFSPVSDVLAECGRILRPAGVLAMTEEVGLRPSRAPGPGEAFLREHPTNVFSAASPDQRRSEFDAAGLIVEVFEPLVDWAVPLLRQRVQLLRLLGHCATRMFGADAYERMTGTLTSAADEYERGSVLPALIVARRSDR